MTYIHPDSYVLVAKRMHNAGLGTFTEDDGVIELNADSFIAAQIVVDQMHTRACHQLQKGGWFQRHWRWSGLRQYHHMVLTLGLAMSQIADHQRRLEILEATRR